MSNEAVNETNEPDAPPEVSSEEKGIIENDAAKIVFQLTNIDGEAVATYAVSPKDPKAYVRRAGVGFVKFKDGVVKESYGGGCATASNPSPGLGLYGSVGLDDHAFGGEVDYLGAFLDAQVVLPGPAPEKEEDGSQDEITYIHEFRALDLGD